MTIKKIVSILTGFFAIALLSSVCAGLHSHLYPSSIELLGSASPRASDSIQLVIKLGYISFSCVLGGMLTTWISQDRKANLMVGLLIMVVIGWLWLKTVSPVWFWAWLMVTVVPCVLTGYTITRLLTRQRP